MEFVKGQTVRTTCALESDDGNQSLTLPKHSKGVIHELPSTNAGLYSIAVGLVVYDVEAEEIEAIPEPPVSLNEAEQLWATGVRAWVDGLNQAGQQQTQLLQKALDCFQASLKASGASKAGAALPTNVLSNEMFCRRCLFVAVSLVDSGRPHEALSYFEACLNPAMPLTFIEYCWALEKMGEISKARRVAVKVVKTKAVWQSAWQRPGYVDRSLEARPFWDPREFSWVDLLQRRTPIILHELDTLLGRREASAWQPVGGEHRETGRMDGTVVSRGNWRELVLFGASAQPSLAPNTCRIITELIPEAVDLCNAGAGEIIFSRLDPQTSISAHCAPTNLRLTAHLGLVVPPPHVGRCEIRVGKAAKATIAASMEEDKNAGGWRRWHEGQVMIFDDSFEHEVVNNTDLPRIVLLIRFWHPQLIQPSARAIAMSNSQSAIEQGKVLRVAPPLRTSFLDQWVHGDYATLSSSEKVRCPKCRSAAPVRFFTTRLDEDDGICAQCVKCKFTSGSSVQNTTAAASSSLSNPPSATSCEMPPSKSSTLAPSSKVPTIATSSSPSRSGSTESSPPFASSVSSAQTTLTRKGTGPNPGTLSADMRTKLQLTQELIKKSGLPIELVEMPPSYKYN